MPFTGIHNFRDLGGYTTQDGRRVKWGQLYRSSKLSGLSPEDQDYLNGTALIYLFHLRDRKEKSLPLFLKILALVEEEGQA